MEPVITLPWNEWPIGYVFLRTLRTLNGGGCGDAAA